MTPSACRPPVHRQGRCRQDDDRRRHRRPRRPRGATLVMSTDAAHCLGDALDVDLTTAAGARAAEVEPGLHALAVGAHTAVEADWQVVRDYLLGVLDAMGVDAVVADELTSLPGAEEVTALLALRAPGRDGDVGPRRRRLRPHRRDAAPARPARGARLAPRPAAARPAPPAPRAAPRRGGGHRRARAGRAVLVALRAGARPARGAAPARADSTSVRLVLTPERVVIAEGRRVLTSLSLHGYAVDAVVVNRVLPARRPVGAASQPPATPTPGARHGTPSASAGGGAGVLRLHPLLRAPYLAREPIGADELDDLHRACTGDVDTDPLTPRPRRGHDGHAHRPPFRAAAAPAAGERRRSRPRSARGTSWS